MYVNINYLAAVFLNLRKLVAWVLTVLRYCNYWCSQQLFYVLCEAFNFTLFGKSNKQDLIKYKKYRANIKKNDKEFENKSADMNFTREQIIKHRESYNNMHETMLENIKKMKLLFSFNE